MILFAFMLRCSVWDRWGPVKIKRVIYGHIVTSGPLVSCLHAPPSGVFLCLRHVYALRVAGLLLDQAGGVRQCISSISPTAEVWLYFITSREEMQPDTPDPNTGCDMSFKILNLPRTSVLTSVNGAGVSFPLGILHRDKHPAPRCGSTMLARIRPKPGSVSSLPLFPALCFPKCCWAGT